MSVKKNQAPVPVGSCLCTYKQSQSGRCASYHFAALMRKDSILEELLLANEWPLMLHWYQKLSSRLLERNFSSSVWAQSTKNSLRCRFRGKPFDLFFFTLFLGGSLSRASTTSLLCSCLMTLSLFINMLQNMPTGCCGRAGKALPPPAPPARCAAAYLVASYQVWDSGCALERKTVQQVEGDLEHNAQMHLASRSLKNKTGAQICNL